MRLFSHRQGHKTYEKEIQQDRVDEETRSRLWTILKSLVWDHWQHGGYKGQKVEYLLDQFWFRYFKRPSDTRPPLYQNRLRSRGEECYEVLRNHFFKGDWFEVYDFIEFIFHLLPKTMTEQLLEQINSVLTEENSAYRLVSGRFAPITNKSEIETVSEATNAGLDGVREHLNTAVAFLSDRKNPNYRNSIKESISAVESLMKVLSEKKSATLSDGIKRIDAVVDLHPALKHGFEKLYAYSSDEEGIRHAIFSNTKVTHGDAKYFLISCSAFINYVIEKFSEKKEKLK